MIAIKTWRTYSGAKARALPFATDKTTRVYVGVGYSGEVIGSIYNGIKMLTSTRSQFTAHAYTRDKRLLIHNFTTLAEAKTYIEEAAQC